MYKVICVKHVQGEMNGYPYDNHKFFCLSDDVPASLVSGQNVEVLKLKTASFDQIIKTRGYDSSTFPGNVLVPQFNQYGNMVDFKIEPAE